MSGRFPFNVRVYGLFVQNGKVLISDERVTDRLITKFPGGGLEFGEGPVDCIIREWKEELGQDVSVSGHFYTTDFFQRSAFHEDDQVISIYYKVEGISAFKVDLRSDPFDLGPNEEEAFRWLDLGEARKEEMTFPVDRKVLAMLIGS